MENKLHRFANPVLHSTYEGIEIYTGEINGFRLFYATVNGKERTAAYLPDLKRRLRRLLKSDK